MITKYRTDNLMEPPAESQVGVAKSEVTRGEAARGNRAPEVPALELIMAFATEETKVGVFPALAE